jgi:hypothetical protein
VVGAAAIMDERTAGGRADAGLSSAPDTGPLSAREAAAVVGDSERTGRGAIARACARHHRIG